MKSYSKVILLGEVERLFIEADHAVSFDMKVHKYKSFNDYIPCRAYGKHAELLAERQGHVLVEGDLRDKVLVKELRFL